MKTFNRHELEIEIALSLHKATCENRISWELITNEENPDQQKYQTVLHNQILEVSFLGVHIYSEIPLNKTINIMSYSIVIISGLGLWIEASSGTMIFSLIQDMLSKIPEKNKIKHCNKLKRNIELINNFNKNV